MMVQLESTSKVVELVINGVTVPARVWDGVTAKGIPCHAYITLISAMSDKDTAEFERDLREQKPPTPEIQAIPLRMIL